MKGHSSFVYGVAFSQDGKWIGSASWDHTAKVWHASTGKEHRSLRQHSGYCSSVAFTPDSRWLVSGSRELKLWDLSGTPAELTD
jgi:WD40 repeat protein